MIDILRTVWNFLLEMVHTAPAAFWPCIVGLLFSALMTQLIKSIAYRKPKTREASAAFTRLLAFVLGLICTFWLWPDAYGFFAGCVVGCLSPFLYAVGVRVIGIRWPAIRDLLSQDAK